MKRVLIFIFAVFLIFIISGCSLSKNKTTDLVESHTFEEEEIDFEIEQILFSKSFQSIDPTVELIPKNNRFRIMASLGLSEYSSVTINNIIKKGNEVNIHISGISNKKHNRLSIPQVVMELKEIKAHNVDELKFNILYDDYTQLKIKFSVNDVLNKIQSHFKVALNCMPEFSLNKTKDKLIWNIKYNSVFDRDHPDIPLVNLTAEIDANSGDILKSEKRLISSSLDNGHILNYMPSKYLLYKKSNKGDSENPTEQLWAYDIHSGDKTMVYSSNFKITSAEFSPDLNYISLIEMNENNSELFVVEFKDLKAYKVSFQEKFNPSIMRWTKDGILYLIESNDKSIVYSYDVHINSINQIGVFKKSIENLIVMDDKFIITERNADDPNHKILITSNWKVFKSIGSGFSPKFINEDLVSYLVKNEKEDTNSLIIYYLKDSRIIGQIPENIINYKILSDLSIAYLRKNINSNDFTLFKYSLEDKTTSEITKLIGDKVYFNEEANIAYLNIVLPFEEEKTEVIYSIDLSN